MFEEKEPQEFPTCEKCGEETSRKMVGDEFYNYCKDCNWVTN